MAKQKQLEAGALTQSRPWEPWGGTIQVNVSKPFLVHPLSHWAAPGQGRILGHGGPPWGKAGAPQLGPQFPV